MKYSKGHRWIIKHFPLHVDLLRNASLSIQKTYIWKKVAAGKTFVKRSTFSAYLNWRFCFTLTENYNEERGENSWEQVVNFSLSASSWCYLAVCLLINIDRNSGKNLKIWGGKSEKKARNCQKSK